MGAMMGPAGVAMGAAARGGPQAPAARTGRKGEKVAKTVSSQLNVTVGDANDPAYLVATQVDVPITYLVTVLGVGTEKGVDWEHLNPPKDGKPKKEGLTFVAATLNHTLESTQWTEGEASQQLKDVLSKLKGVVEGIKAETAKDQQLMAEKARADSTIVKQWQDTTMDGKAKVTKLVATANSLPGSAPGAVSSVLRRKPRLLTDVSVANRPRSLARSPAQRLLVTKRAVS
jgi:hypothetical protein